MFAPPPLSAHAHRAKALRAFVSRRPCAKNKKEAPSAKALGAERYEKPFSKTVHHKESRSQQHSSPALAGRPIIARHDPKASAPAPPIRALFACWGRHASRRQVPGKQQKNFLSSLPKARAQHSGARESPAPQARKRLAQSKASNAKP